MATVCPVEPDRVAGDEVRAAIAGELRLPEPSVRRNAEQVDALLHSSPMSARMVGLLSRVGRVPELQRLHADHAPAVLAFELANRAYFTSFISDRGDEFFENFAERHNEQLAEQEAGTGAYYVLVADDGSVLGRFNLFRIQDGTAELGYRIAQQVAGRGVATATVRDLCGLAAARHGLRALSAKVTHDNVASQRVLAKAGFVPAGPADIVGKPGTWYQRDLAAG